MATTKVSAQDNFFDPADVTINKGDTVEWKNEGTHNHDVTSDKFAQLLTPGQTFSYKFDEAGRVDYVCTIHEALGMVGTVTVNAT